MTQVSDSLERMTENGDIPDLFGRAGRIKLVAQAIAGLQEHIMQTELLQSLNGADGTDEHPAVEGRSYDQVRTDCRESLERIRRDFPFEWGALSANAVEGA